MAQWADLHNGLATAWVGADPTHGAYVDSWTKAHPALVADWVKANPSTPQPKAADLALVFFENFSKENPGTQVPTVRLQLRLNRSRMVRIFSRSSSTCGGRNILTLIYRTSLVIW